MTTHTEQVAGTEALRRVYDMSFGRVYPMYVEKAENKDRTKREVDKILRTSTDRS